MQKQPTHKSVEGFTLIELVIAVAIIGILTSVAVLGYNQYKVRAYDAHSKQALRDILLQCNAFWLDHDTSQVCNHATVAEVYVASDEIVLKFPAEDLPDLPGGSQGNFCASAQHESSPNTYSIDSASLISSGSDCSGTSGTVQTASTGGSVQTASVAVAEPENLTCKGTGRVLTLEEKRILEHVVISAINWCQGGQSEWKPNPDKENQFEWKNNAIDSKIAKYKQRYLDAKESEGEGYRNRWQREADQYASFVIEMNFKGGGPLEIPGATYNSSTHEWNFPASLTEAQKERLAVTTSSYMSSGERGFFRYSDNNTP